MMHISGTEVASQPSPVSHVKLTKSSCIAPWRASYPPNNVFIRVTVNLLKILFSRHSRWVQTQVNRNTVVLKRMMADTKPLYGSRANCFEGKLAVRPARRRRVSAAHALKLAIAIANTSAGIFLWRSWHMLSEQFITGWDACYRIIICSKLMVNGDCWQQHQVMRE